MASSIKAIREAMVRRRRRTGESASPRGEGGNPIPQNIREDAIVIPARFANENGEVDSAQLPPGLYTGAIGDSYVLSTGEPFRGFTSGRKKE